jgi:D-xylose reductase
VTWHCDRVIEAYLRCSNCQGVLLLDILRYARFKPQVLQIERHPYLNQEALIALAKELGIAVTGYSSFGPQGYIELAMDRGAQSLFTHTDVCAVASRLRKSESFGISMDYHAHQTA